MSSFSFSILLISFSAKNPIIIIGESVLELESGKYIFEEIKNFLIQKLSQIQNIGHFIRTPNGYRVTNPEGFVAVDKKAGAVKLVDRLEFSRANFTIAKDWVKG